MSLSEEVRSRCHVKHTIPRWQTDSNTEQSIDSNSGNQNVRRQKSWDMLDQSAIAYARQQQHKVQHQVNISHMITKVHLCYFFLPLLFLHFYEFKSALFFSHLMDVVLLEIDIYLIGG